ncbi:TcpQ domain-containing protein [Ruegeria atlantica]|uniref:TcpQ domain-containing protein n=1 Tax=Ruegeria atlantica TaxID=81569 RepID=UPI00147A78C7|nr:TcpQ domain-containing protein [Ruegeria atlantica]
MTPLPARQTLTQFTAVAVIAAITLSGGPTNGQVIDAMPSEQAERIDPLPLPPGFPVEGKATSLPPPAVSPATSECPPYTVVVGDTLSEIAERQLGAVSRSAEIERINGLTGKSVIRPGQVLRLPCAAAGGKLQDFPQLARVPLWTAHSGELVSDVITRWAKPAGYRVVHSGAYDWEVQVPISIRGSFRQALEDLISGFEDSGRPIWVNISANNVIVIGGAM